MKISFLYKFFLVIGIVVLLPFVYLNISKMVSDDTILTVQEGSLSSNNFLAVPKGIIEIYDEKIAKIDNLDDLKSFVDDEIQKNNFEGIEYTYLY